VKRLWLIFAIALVVSLGLDLLIGGQKHGEYFWVHIPGFFAVFGFISCVVIIVVSKYIGHHWLQRKEDYYDRSDRDD
jgi:hypothetical protein